MSRVKNLKTTFKNISPYVKPYKVGFIISILCIIGAVTISANSPKIEGLIITQLTNDVIEIAKGLKGASVNFNYVGKCFSW